MVFIYLPILYLKNWLLKKGENYNPFPYAYILQNSYCFLKFNIFLNKFYLIYYFRSF